MVPRFELDTPRVNSEAPIGLIKKTSTKRQAPAHIGLIKKDKHHPLEIAARAKITKHQAAYRNNNSTSFMPGVASTSGRLHCELLRLLFLQAHRETEEYCRLFGVPAQTNQDSFRYKRLAFYSGIKGKVGLIFAKAAALRIREREIV